MSDAWALVDPTEPVLAPGIERLRDARREALAGGAVHTGWKVGFNDPGIRSLVGIPSGVVGFLTDSTHATSGRVGIPHSGAAVEVEIAFRLSDTLGTSDDDARVMAAIVAIAVAFEVVVIGELDITDGLARDVWHHGYAVGEFVPWSSGVLEGVELELAHNGDDVEVPTPAAGPLADVASMLRFTASGAAAVGEALRANDVILSGSLASALIFVTPGDAVSVRSDVLGDLDLQLSPL
jgi:2-keto-4-pentenoate hydratase